MPPIVRRFVCVKNKDTGLPEVVEVTEREHSKTKAKRVPRWPLVGEAAGCMPEQVDECREAVRKLGIQGVEYMPDGRVQYAGPKARFRHLRSLGLHDKHDFR